MISTSASSTLEGYDDARGGVGLIDRDDRGRIIVSGADRATYLQGLLTNDIEALGPGGGCYAAYLTAQGRMIADLWVYEIGDALLLTLVREVKDTVLGRLEQFVFTEDVQIRDATDTLRGIASVGPRAADVVALALDAVTPERLAALPDHGNLRARFGATPVIVLRVSDPGVTGYDLLIDGPELPALVERLVQLGARPVGRTAAEALRIEAGIPRFARDMDETTIPLEAGIEGRAISFTKGCYVGQEVIARVLHRGHGRVVRRLVGLVIDAEERLPPGSVVQVDGREVGRVTSSVVSPALGRPIALAYVHRDFTAPDTAVTAGGRAARVTTLPFVVPPG